MGIKPIKRKEVERVTKLTDNRPGSVVTKKTTIRKKNGSSKVKERSTSYDSATLQMGGGGKSQRVKAAGKRVGTTVTKSKYDNSGNLIKTKTRRAIFPLLKS